MPRSRSFARASAPRRWTSADARTVLDVLDRSELSVAAFAAREGLDAQRLYAWRRRLGATDLTAITPAFVEVRHRGIERDRLEIVLRSGRILRVAESVDVEVLRRIVNALDEDP